MLTSVAAVLHLELEPSPFSNPNPGLKHETQFKLFSTNVSVFIVYFFNYYLLLRSGDQPQQRTGLLSL